MLEPESGVFRRGDASADGIAGRNPDGSIDYGYYRRQASKLRRAKLREALRRPGRYVPALVAIAIIAAAVLAMPMRDRQQPPPHAGVLSSWMDDISQRIVGSPTRPFDQRKL